MSGGPSRSSGTSGSEAPAPRRVLFLVNDLRFGGAEKHVVTLVNRLDPARFECHLLRLGPGEDLMEQVEPGRLAGTLAFERRSRISVGAVRGVRSYIRRHQIDVVVCVNEYPALYGYLAGRLSGRRPQLIELFHTTTMLDRGAALKMRLVYRWVFARLDAVVFVAPEQKAQWTRARGMRTRKAPVIHNGIDPQYYSPAGLARAAAEVRDALAWPEDAIVVGTCAALRPEKRHVDVVSAVSLLADEGLPVRLLLVGDGPERAALMARAEALGVSELVHVTGFQADVRPFVAACDVMVLASEAETFPLANLESMAMGKPVICTDVGGARGQVREGVTGYLVAPGDVEQLAAGIRGLTDPEQRRAMGAAGRRRVQERFTEQRMVSQYEALLWSSPSGDR